MHNLIRYVMLAKIDRSNVAKCVHITGTPVHGIGLMFSNKTSTISYRYTSTNNMKRVSAFCNFMSGMLLFDKIGPILLV